MPRASRGSEWRAAFPMAWSSAGRERTSPVALSAMCHSFRHDSLQPLLEVSHAVLLNATERLRRPRCVHPDAGAVRLEVTKFTTPCVNIAGSFTGRDIARLSQKIRPGWSRVCARVLASGRIRVGDAVRLTGAGRGS